MSGQPLIVLSSVVATHQKLEKAEGDPRPTLTLRALSRAVRRAIAAGQDLDTEIVVRIFDEESDESSIGGLVGVSLECGCDGVVFLALDGDPHAARFDEDGDEDDDDAAEKSL